MDSYTHNLIYWCDGHYLGLGVSAHSPHGGQRWWNVLLVPANIELINKGDPTSWPSPAAEGSEMINRPLEMAVTMMLNLRLTYEGVAEAEFRQRFGLSLNEVYGNEILDMERLRLIIWRNGQVGFTRRGQLLGNRVFA